VYLNNSQIDAPSGGFVVGDVLRWTVCANRTAAGTTACGWNIYVGTNGTTGDTQEVNAAFTPTAAADTTYLGVLIIIQTTGSSARAQWSLQGTKGSANAAGWYGTAVSLVAQGTFTFNSTTSNLIFGLALTTGLLESVTIDSVIAELL
jgi:hypothetical protein